jgi:hypothetical protein
MEHQKLLILLRRISQPLGDAKRGFTPGEGARDAASFHHTRHNSPHRPTSPLTLLSLFLSLSSPKPADDFSSTAENCTDGGGPASSPLPRIVGEQASGRISTAACKMSVSTLNPHLVHSISLHDVCRRVLVDMHSRSARFRVRSQYCSAGVFSPFVAPMMCAAARVRV